MGYVVHKGAAAGFIAAFVCLVGVLRAAEVADSLISARALWSKTAPKNYSYVVKTSSTAITLCRNAKQEAIQANPVRIAIREGRADQVATLRQQEVSGSCLAVTYTIEKLFDYIALENSRPNSAGCLEVSYDSTYGFPTKIEHRCELDGDTPITVSDFRVSS